jgi:succinoglycan biosynthesis transport protein ExoP
MDARDYLRVLRRRKATVVVATFLCAMGALVLSLAAAPTYQAEAKLLVIAGSRSEGGINSAYEGALLSQQLVKSFSEMLGSRAVAEAALRLDPHSMSPSELQSRIHAEPILDTLLIKLTVQDQDPKRARRLANMVARAFILKVPSFQGGSALRVSLVEPALTPTVPITPRTKANVVLGCLLGLLMGIGLAFLREHLDTSIKDPESLERAAGVPVVGSIPVFKVQKEPLPVAHRPRSVEAESFRKLRTNFAFLGVDQQSLCCLVTSPSAGEGKSTVTANLALALAHAGQRVIVVEADLRKPMLHELFPVRQRTGLTTVLMDHTEPEDALQPFGTESIAILASGQLPPNPSELLGSRRMADLISALRKQADIVLLDCPPLLPVTDPMALAQFADGVLLVARAGKTTSNQIRAARITCDKAGASLFGAVLNATRVAHADQPSYYGYYGSKQVSEDRPPTITRSDRTRAGRRTRRRSA